MSDYIHPPEDNVLPAFPKAQKAKAKNWFPGGLRRRWKDRDHIYEWDYQKGHVEIFNSTGKTHLGGFDHKTGKQIAKADPTKKTEP